MPGTVQKKQYSTSKPYICSTVQIKCSTNTLQYRYSTVQIQHSTNTIQYSTDKVQYRYSTVQIQYSTNTVQIQYSTVVNEIISALSIKSPIFELSCQWNVLNMKCSIYDFVIYEITFLWCPNTRCKPYISLIYCT